LGQRRLSDTVESGALIKTHNARVLRRGRPLIDPGATRRALYVVRNPLDVVDSMADHAALSIDEAIARLAAPRHRLGRSDGLAGQFLGSWSAHVRSWTEHASVPVLILRYEHLLANPHRWFSRLLDFLEWPLEPERLDWAIEETKFDALRRKESEDGFPETSRVAKSGSFFRHGMSHRWPEVLTREQAERVFRDHAPAMRSIDYEIPDLDRVYGER